MQCCESGTFIPDPGSELYHPGCRVKKIPGSASASKNLSILTQKVFLSAGKYNSGCCSSRIRIPDLHLVLFYPFRIPGPVVKRHRIPHLDPQHFINVIIFNHNINIIRWQVIASEISSLLFHSREGWLLPSE
jgi:hypothetical protein